MRIALVVPGGLDPSGRERVVPVLLWFVERLAKRHDVHAFVLDYFDAPRSYPLLGAVVHDLGRVHAPRGLRRVRMHRRLAAGIAAHGPFDVIHSYWGMPAGVVATRVAADIRVPAVVTFTSGELVAIQDIEYGLQRRWIDRIAIARTMKRAAALTVPTAFMARLAEALGVRPRVIPMGVDTSRFPLVDRADGPPWRLIRVGSINRVKDHATLLHAIAILRRTMRDVHLDIVGEDTLRGAMQALAARLRVDDRVAFHGVQPTDRLHELYARAHLNIVSSRHEASNVSMLEAASTGLPSVGSAVGHLADWHPDAALAVAPRDPGALADAIRTVLGDSTMRARLAANARAWTIAHDTDWSAAAFEQVYRDVTGR